MAELTPGIHVKFIPEDVFKKILQKQRDEKDLKRKKINLSQAVIMLLKEAYVKK